MDRRLTPATPRAAHVSLRGKVAAAAYVEGEALRVVVPLADLLSAPGGGRERQLWLGDAFTVIDRDQGHTFGFAGKDGYCGWLPEAAVAPAPEPSHWVASVGTHAYPEPRVQAREAAALPMGARVAVLAGDGMWARTPQGFVPARHLRALGEWEADPVAVALRFLGTPYLWGGNSRAGLDCSGLVQGAYLACGRPCPADSDLQQALGAPIAESAPLQRGDLLFWKGHVAMVVDGQNLIHANGHAMAVALEDIGGCTARILAQGGGGVTARRRFIETDVAAR